MKFNITAKLEEGFGCCSFDADVTWLALDPRTAPFSRDIPQRITEISMTDGQTVFKHVLPDLVYPDEEIKERMNFDAAEQYDKKHNVFNKLCEAFEVDGNCGHDLGLTGALAVIREWEKIRTPEAVADLNGVKRSWLQRVMNI